MGVSTTTSAPRKPSWLRRGFRWCRWLAFIGLLGLSYGLVHLNQIGLPGFLKGPLIDQLRARGLNLEFSRLRIRLGRGLVAENVNVDRTGELAGEHFHADEIQLKLGWEPLREFRTPEIKSLRIRNGEVTLPLADELGAAPYLFRVDQVMGQLVFITAEEWELRSLEAGSHRGRFRAFGSITNASVLRRPRDPKKPISIAWKKTLRELGRVLDGAQFTNPPLLSVAFHADLRQPELATADVELRAPRLQVSAGDFSEVILSASLNQPPGVDGRLPATLRLEAARAITRWGEARELLVNVSGDLAPTNAIPERVEWSVRARKLSAAWGESVDVAAQGKTVRTNGAFASEIRLRSPRVVSFLNSATSQVERVNLNLAGRHGLTNWSEASGALDIGRSRSPWVGLEAAGIHFDATPRPEASSPQIGIGGWLNAVALHLRVEVTNVLAHIPAREAVLPGDRVGVELDWNGEQLRLIQLTANLPAGTVSGRGALDVPSRRAQVDFNGALDLHAYESLLTPAAQHWLGQYGWDSNRPPEIIGSIGLVLPAWTNRHPDWRGEVVPSLTLAGHVTGGPFTFRGIPGDHATGDFTYTNHVWRVPEMTATRPEGLVRFSYEGDDSNHTYHFRIHSTLDPRIIRPVLEQERQRQTLDEFVFMGAPVLEGDIWGRWKVRDQTGFDVRVAATNVIFRGEAIESVSGRVAYTNGMFVATDADLRSGGEAHVPGGAYDALHHRLSFTNTTTTLAPQRVARLIGTKSSQVMSNYLFGIPPSTRIQGVISTDRNPGDTDIVFTAAAPDFRWWRIGLTNASARLHFRGETLELSGLDAGVYDGRAYGDLFFDWKKKGNTKIRADLQVTDVNLSSVMHTLVSPTNRLEGVLQGRVHLNGHTGDTNSWSGSGEVALRDGFLWDLPLFGIFSTVFDAISPGIGQTRFKAGQMNFTITNSILSTRDLEVRSATMRLGYRGKVGLNSKLDARMEAELFRDAPLIGPLLNFALTPFTKLFEYDVKGTLRKPKAEPRYVPKLFLAPLRPLKTLRELLPKDSPPEVKTAHPPAELQIPAVKPPESPAP